MQQVLIFFAQTVSIPGIPKVSLGENAIQQILSATFLFIGGFAVLFILIGAVWYAISSGDQSRLSKAKDTILYSVIGLIVSISAFAIVQFVIGRL